MGTSRGTSPTRRASAIGWIPGRWELPGSPLFGLQWITSRRDCSIMAEQKKDAEKKPRKTVAAVSAELNDLQDVAKTRQTRIRDLEIQIQKIRDLVKTQPAPNSTLQQDHYRLSNVVKDIRKLVGLPVDG
ncbi:hypothetical protein FF47_39 [Mycobacterium phage FF47]|uniref:Uncharacterized protein n=2 Tax=Mapvirus Ff47 TaxID=1920751 RepID=A0A899INC4_9CAUD|nr:hypothetical protein FF47_39 [Mycobacterium phage FF47]AGI12308.1 hypothetical protein FF47_39 [Mycobacterium phage FF47]QSL99574.1 hypothetical protein [Mycobacterium phage Maco2]QXN76646.1 hypothetical protein [Mycobacterium phage Maco7]UNY41891.1 hypothetical protein [Mycobacterium phage Maco6]